MEEHSHTWDPLVGQDRLLRCTGCGAVRELRSYPGDTPCRHTWGVGYAGEGDLLHIRCRWCGLAYEPYRASACLEPAMRLARLERALGAMAAEVDAGREPWGALRAALAEIAGTTDAH